MKRFLLKVLSLLLFVLLIDILCGKFLDWCIAKGGGGGSMERNYYALTQTHADCLIFGSSKASHHYVPSVIEDALGMSAYNCGQDGNGIYYAYPVISTILKRYTPRCIIYDLKPEFDFCQFQSDERYIAPLKIFYGKYNDIDSIVDRIDPTQKIKMCSNLYRFNSQITSPIVGLFKSHHDEMDGYLPLYGSFNGPLEKDSVCRPVCDDQKIGLLEKLIDKCKAHKVRFIFVVSPSLYGENKADYEPAVELARRKHVPFLFEGDNKLFVGKRSLFKDPPHLNDSGARLYTEYLVQKLKNYESGFEASER